MINIVWGECRYAGEDAVITLRYNLWTGKEQVFVGDKLVSQARSFRLNNSHSFTLSTKSGEMPYRIEFGSTGNAGIWPRLTVYRNGKEVFSEVCNPLGESHGKTPGNKSIYDRGNLVPLVISTVVALLLDWIFVSLQIFYMPNRWIDMTFFVVFLVMVLSIRSIFVNKKVVFPLVVICLTIVSGVGAIVFNNKQYPSIVLEERINGINLTTANANEGKEVFVLEFAGYGCSECREFFTFIFHPLYERYLAQNNISWTILNLPGVSGDDYSTSVTYCAARQGEYVSARRFLSEQQSIIDREQANDFYVKNGRWDSAAYLQCLRTAGVGRLLRYNYQFGRKFGIEEPPVLLLGIRHEDRYEVLRIMPGIQPLRDYISTIDYLIRR